MIQWAIQMIWIIYPIESDAAEYKSYLKFFVHVRRAK